jgi:hypothetical protein
VFLNRSSYERGRDHSPPAADVLRRRCDGPQRDLQVATRSCLWKSLADVTLFVWSTNVWMAQFVTLEVPRLRQRTFRFQWAVRFQVPTERDGRSIPHLPLSCFVAVVCGSPASLAPPLSPRRRRRRRRAAHSRPSRNRLSPKSTRRSTSWARTIPTACAANPTSCSPMATGNTSMTPKGTSTSTFARVSLSLGWAIMTRTGTRPCSRAPRYGLLDLANVGDFLTSCYIAVGRVPYEQPLPHPCAA